MTLQFRYCGLIVSDVLSTIRFYNEAFGLETRYVHPSSGYAELATGGVLLAFIGEQFIEKTELLGRLRYAPNRVDSDAPGQVIALVTADLEADWKRATAAGATVVKMPEAKPWGQTAGYLRDCNGVVVELCTRSPRDQADASG